MLNTRVLDNKIRKSWQVVNSAIYGPLDNDILLFMYLCLGYVRYSTKVEFPNFSPCFYGFNPSLELSLLPYVEKYHSSTYFFMPHNSRLGPFWLDHGGRGG
jgi:hypothetical protein